jgi:integrase
MEQRPKKLLDQACTELCRSVRDAIRLKHYSIRTEEAYVGWITRFILFHDKRHPNEMGRTEIEAFLTHLAVEQNVAASTQNQAFSALLFLYREVLHQDLDGPIDALRASKPKRLPTVLTKDEVHRVLSYLSGTHQLMARLLYGSGLRLMECLRLRVKDLDFGHTSFPRGGCRWTLAAASCAATTWTRAACKRPSGRRPRRPESPRRWTAIDLHPRPQSRRVGRPQSAGPAVLDSPWFTETNDRPRSRTLKSKLCNAA